MKILLTGGGTGGHFYPLIAIAEELNILAEKERLLDVKLYYMSDKPYDKQALYNNNITFVSVPAGKMRTYSSIKNFFDMISAGIGAIVGVLRVFAIYPDVIISKGGYGAFPAVFAAKVLHIPLIVHESDSYPGRLNEWSAKFARRIAVSYSEAGEKFPKDKVAWTGQPVRKEIVRGDMDTSYDFFKLNKTLPTILVQGGSQGAEKINNTILDALPLLVDKYQILHQTGPKNYDEVVLRANLILEKNPNKEHYLPFAYMNNLTTKMASGSASIVVSRAGSTIFEIALWGIPSIIIPITASNGDHQRKNAFNYARAGACEVIEEANLTPHVLVAEIDKIMHNKERYDVMVKKTHAFATPDAANKIAREALNIALSHEE